MLTSAGESQLLPRMIRLVSLTQVCASKQARNFDTGRGFVIVGVEVVCRLQWERTLQQRNLLTRATSQQTSQLSLRPISLQMKIK
jgi:hypothetical protein